METQRWSSSVFNKNSSPARSLHFLSHLYFHSVFILVLKFKDVVSDDAAANSSPRK